MTGKRKGLSKEAALAVTLALWAAAAWLLYPLVRLDDVDTGNVKEYFYRSAAGLTILIIFFGKTLHDLIFPWVTFRKLPRFNAVLLTLYLIVLSGGVILVIVRMAALFMKSRARQGFFL